MIGRTLHHYRVVRTLVSGGMGEVYAAEDAKLHRLSIALSAAVWQKTRRAAIRQPLTFATSSRISSSS
jgi:hypothetical protein